MHAFLTHNREELIERCKAKVARRPHRSATATQLSNGVPMFLYQLTAEGIGDADEGLLAAVLNLLQNAFKFTHSNTPVTLHAHAEGERIFIDVQDHFGGLAPGTSERMFTPFHAGRSEPERLGVGRFDREDGR